MFPMSDEIQEISEVLAEIFSTRELITLIELVMRVEQTGYSVVIKRA